MSGKAHTWRELLYLHPTPYSSISMLVAESESQRLAGRGGLGYLVQVDAEAITCTCPATDDCWHAREAPNALIYWRIRLQHGEMSREQFDAFYQQWWPRRAAIMGRAREEGSFKGKGEAEWELFYSAMLDEFNARSVAYGKLERTFGKDLLAAVLNVEPQREEA